MYAATTGTGLGADLNLKLTRGSFATPPGGGDCTGFTADATDDISHGAGVLYDAALSSFATTWAGGTVDPSVTTFPTAEVWTQNEAHAYQFTITLPSGTANSEQGKTASTTFSWETRDASDAASGSAGWYYANAVLGDRPASYWRLDETSGTVAADGVGGHNGNVSGASLRRPGALQGGHVAYAHGSAGDSINVGDVDDFAGRAAFTVEAWVQLSADFGPEYCTFAAKRRWTDPSDNSGWFATVVAGSDPNVMFNRSEVGETDYGWSSAPLTRGRWYHLALTYDGSTMRVYVDGQLENARGSVVSLEDTNASLTADLGQGCAVDELALYPRALSSDEILAHYDARN